MPEILQGQFFWGIIVGLLLAAFGAWRQAKHHISLLKKHQKELITKLCIDVIKNIQSTINEMNDMKQKVRAIHRDYLNLIEVELLVYGRNREHIIHLPDATRDKVRKFMNDCAIKRANIAAGLGEFYRLQGEADQLQAEGHAAEAAQIRQRANIALGDADRNSDQLGDSARDAPGILSELAKV